MIECSLLYQENGHLQLPAGVSTSSDFLSAANDPLSFPIGQKHVRDHACPSCVAPIGPSFTNELGPLPPCTAEQSCWPLAHLKCVPLVPPATSLQTIFGGFCLSLPRQGLYQCNWHYVWSGSLADGKLALQALESTHIIHLE